jgi:hypothetical protein
MSAVLTYPDIVSQRPHWLAGVGGFELTNVASKIDGLPVWKSRHLTKNKKEFCLENSKTIPESVADLPV